MKKKILIMLIAFIILAISLVNATVTISSPIGGIDTRNRTITLIASTDTLGASLLYNVNDERFRLLCSNCGLNNHTRRISLKNGGNTISVREGSESDSLKEINVNVDPRAPIINKILPENKKYSNGSFQVYFKEDNFDNASLFYRLPTDSVFTKKPIDKNTECSNSTINVWNCTTLSNFNDGDSVLFAFSVSDKIGTTLSNTFTTIIDETDPILDIISPESSEEVGRHFLLQVGVSEKVSISYDIDHNGRFRRLCSNCNFVESTLSLTKGEHAITVNVVDNAGNEDEETITVTAI